MRALLGSMVVLLAACPSSQTTASIPDPRLGVVVFETNDRAFSRAPPISNANVDGHVIENRGRLAFAPDGTVFVVIGLDSGRPFGTANDVTPSRVVVKKVSPAGVVTELPSPTLGSAVARKNTALRVAGDGSTPYLFEVFGDQNPAGRFATVTFLEGESWKSVSFLRSDRVDADGAGTWDSRNDQSRVLRPGVLFVQHGNTLARRDGASWVPVSAPPKMKEIRLGAAEANRIRVYWVDTDGAFVTDVLNADGTWVGTPVRSRHGTSASLAGAWGFAGDVDTFTAHYVVGQNVFVLRFENGALRLASQRPVANDELTGEAYLEGTRHPQRSAFMRAGTLTASFQGRETGLLGNIIGWANGANVTCTNDVTVGEGMVIAKSGQQCVPRVLHTLDYRVSDDLTSMAELFADEHQDAMLRFYVKRVPLPSTSTDITITPTPDAGFPGDTGGGMPTDQLFISGHVLLPGAMDHLGTSCVLTRRPSMALVEAVMTDGDGAVTFGPVDRGEYSVDCNHANFATFSQSFTAAQSGPAACDAVLVSIQLPLNAQGDHAPWELDGGTLTHWPLNGASMVLSTSVESVRFLDPAAVDALVWKETSGWFRFSGGPGTFAPPRDFSSFRFVANNFAVAVGVPDGTTPLSWVNAFSMTPFVSGPVLGFAQFGTNNSCSGTIVWSEVAPGDVRAQRGDCQQPLGLVASTRTATPSTPLKRVTGIPSGVFGLAGDGCGEEGSFTKACSLHTLTPISFAPMVDTELATSVIDARVQSTGLGARLVVLERTGPSTGRLSTGPFGSPALGIVVQPSLPLPTSWLPGETPITFVDEGGQRFLVRTDTEAYVSLGTAGSWTRVAGNVRAVFANGVVLQTDGTLLHVTTTGTVETLPMRGNENLRVVGSTLYSDEGTMTCPDGSTCHLIERFLIGGGFTSLAVGRFVTDVVANPVTFGWPTVRDSRADLAWPARRVSVFP